MHKRILIVLGSALLLVAGYTAGTRSTTAAQSGSANADPANTTATYAVAPQHSTVPKSYGRLAAVIPDSIGTGLVFEDAKGVIRFVSVTGMKEGELARYDTTPIHGGIPRSYGHLVSAVVNNGSTALIFEDVHGVIRLVTLAGVTESELTRN